MNNLNVKNSFWKFFKKLSNLNLSLSVLSSIATVCVIGSVLEQKQDSLYYKLNYINYYHFILSTGLDHIFRTWWFIFLLLVFILSLLSCTLTTQLPSLKNARHRKFTYSEDQHRINQYDINLENFVKYSSANMIYSLFLIFATYLFT